MESSINEQLLDKYWGGKTSVNEEKEIRAHFSTNPSLSKESDYFRFIKRQQQVKFDQKVAIKTKRKRRFAAATITMGIITTVAVLYESKEDSFAEKNPQKALEITKKALMMVSEGLNEGQSYTMEIMKINKVKEELKKESQQVK